MSISDSIVLITSSNPDNTTFGTGFIIHQDRNQQVSYLLTCAHVIRDIEGKEKLCVSSHPASVVAYGDPDGQGVDLAVLQAEGLTQLPPLPLQAGAREGDGFSATGFQQFKPNHLLRPVHGRLGHPIGIDARGGAERIAAWDLIIQDDYNLQPGYSGSPVVSGKTNFVLGVVSTRIGDGQKGIAISIKGLKTILPESLSWLCAEVEMPACAQTSSTAPKQNSTQQQVDPKRIPWDIIDIVAERRIQADDWKQLHVDFQTISSQLVFVRGVISPSDLKTTLPALENHWQQCSDNIYQFVQLNTLPDRAVKSEFTRANEDSKLLRILNCLRI